METNELKPILEAMIFASEEPLTVNAMTLVLSEAGVEKDQVKAALEELVRDLNDNAEKGLLLREVGGGFQMVTKPTMASWVQKLNVAKPRSLSQASLETLAIIAYRQPLIRSEVEAIRGVDSGGVLKTLLERGLIKILGRKEDVGQPLIYGTTAAFLELFHINHLEELPSMKEIEELVESQNQLSQSDIAEEGTETELVWTESAVGIAEGEAGLSLIAEEGDESGALADLENSLKELKALEKEMFPKEVSAEGVTEQPADAEAAPVTADASNEPEL
ncbi:MAG: SMC-Scp complex subunit ScpB [Deltaproteobacteria bacterium]|nr:SMC-Scp complex subunit ScpB [Deltaproteobacteria bacterium]